MTLRLLSRSDKIQLITRGESGRDGIGFLGARERPGDVLGLFTSSLSGAGEALPPIAAGQIVTTDVGRVLRIPSAVDPIIVAARQDFAVEEGQVYAARWVTRRFKNTSDPYGDAVEYRIAWLDANKAFISTVVADKRALLVADGRYAFQASFSRDLDADITAPAGARYVRPYVRLLGGNGITDVEVVSRWETTGLPGPKGDDGHEPEYFLDEDAERIAWRQADGTIGPELDIGSARKKAEAAAALGAGYASDAASKGNTIYSTIAGMSGIVVPEGMNAIRVNGRADRSDGQGGLFVDTDNGSDDSFVSADGRTWYRSFDYRSTYVQTRALLQSVPVFSGALVRLTDGGRSGDFIFREGDLSAAVSNDAPRGIYLPPTSSPDGSNGAWVRSFDGAIYGSWFGLVGDNATDNTAAFRAMMKFAEGRTVVLDRGIYRTGPFKVPGNFTIKGAGRLATTIRALPGHDLSQPLIINEVISAGNRVRQAKAIRFETLSIDNPLATEDATNSLVAFLKVEQVTLHDVGASDHRYMLAAFSGCSHVAITGQSVFRRWGKVTESTEGGSALWFGVYGPDLTPTDTYSIGKECVFEDGEWSAIYANGRYGQISGTIRNVKESAIFGSAFVAETGQYSEHHISFSDLLIETTRRKHISSSGIELGKAYVTFGANVRILDTGSSIVSLTDCQIVGLSNVQMSNPRRQPQHFPQGSFVDIITTEAAPNQPRSITVSGLECSGFGLTVGDVAYNAAYAPVNVQGPGAPVDGIVIEDNSFTGITFDHYKVMKGPGKWTANCYNRRNAGLLDNSPFVNEFGIPANPGQMSFDCGFRPSSIHVEAIQASTTQLRHSVADFNEAGIGRCFAMASGSNGYAYPSGNRAMTVIDAAGTTIAEATLALTQDGFTLNFSAVAPNVTCRVVAHP